MRRRNKKAYIQDLIVAMIFIFVASIIFVTVKYSYGIFVDKATNITSFNSSQAAVDALDTTNELTNRYDYIVFMLLIAFSLSIIVVAYFAAAHQLFVFLYFVALVIVVIISSILSFVWDKVAHNTPIFESTIESFPIMDLILSNFPIYIAVLGFIGMLVMFTRPRG